MTDADTYIGELSNIPANMVISRYNQAEKSIKKKSNSPINLSPKISGVKKR